MVLVVYVDDILVSTHRQEAVEQFIGGISKHFATKYLGEVTYCLGCHIARNRNDQVLELNQHLYVTSTPRLAGNALSL